MAFENYSTKLVDCASTMMVVVVEVSATEVPDVEVVVIGMVAKILSSFSFYFKSISMLGSIFRI